MYSGFALSNHSGNWLGVHQKFDRIAYRFLKKMLAEQGADDVFFPSLSQILYFEGRNGPDGLKIKSPGRDEPHHFYNPHQPQQTTLLVDLKYHFDQLKEALVRKDAESAAWQAAWLAHVIVDGLTPAHHHPYEEQSYLLRGENIGQQTRILDKVLIKGGARKNTSSRLSLMTLIGKNWSLWGSKGLILNHALFELGVALIVKPARFGRFKPDTKTTRRYMKGGLIETFKDHGHEIADHEIYENFNRWGWTPKLALQIKNIVTPLMIQLTTLAWYEASLASGSVKSSQQQPGRAASQNRQSAEFTLFPELLI